MNEPLIFTYNVKDISYSKTQINALVKGVYIVILLKDGRVISLNGGESAVVYKKQIVYIDKIESCYKPLWNKRCYSSCQ